MPTNILLITENMLRKYTDLNDAVDSQLLQTPIREAQDLHLQNTIGTALYKRILDDVKLGTLSGDYKILLEDYIQDFLIYAAYYEALEYISIRSRNNGLLNLNGGDNASPVDMEMYNNKRQSVKNKMDIYDNRLTKYISVNHNKFTELYDSEVWEENPDLTVKFHNPFIRGSKDRIKLMKDCGIQVYDSSKSHLPQ